MSSSAYSSFHAVLFTDDSYTQPMAILQKPIERLENISKTAESLISADAAGDAVAQVTKMYGLLEMYKKGPYQAPQTCQRK